MSLKIDAWLAANTFHHGDWPSVPELVAEKERKGLSISLCIPTLNEADTIGDVVSVLKESLVDRHPLVDEIAVIDSGSDDRTREVAGACGADVFHSGDILPEFGFRKGKGENLWKAVYQLRGDLICYVDGDIRHIHPGFCTGLVAPLIYRDELKYIKGFYDRPIADSDKGGGRVTEILIRPLFSLFFPELTALIQPMSGEYAVRRELLEQIPFPTGYGVETSHLLDVYHRWGLEVFGQTDLEERRHHNKTTRELGEMAFEIYQSFFSRLESFGMIDRLPEMSDLFRQFEPEGDRRQVTLKSIVEEERPPMATVAAYREKMTEIGRPVESIPHFDPVREAG